MKIYTSFINTIKVVKNTSLEININSKYLLTKIQFLKTKQTSFISIILRKN